jgi:MFS family permease
VACAINCLVGVALIIAMVDVPLFINAVLAEGSSTDEMLRTAAVRSGQVLAVFTGTMALASLLGGWLCARLGYRIPMVLGLVAGVAGFALMGTWHPDVAYGAMALHLALAGLGFALVTSPLSTAVIDAVGETQRGVASGLVVILRLIGMSVGLSLLTAWGLRRFEDLSSAYTVSELGGVIMDLTAQVLDETFLIAGGILALAIPAVLAVRNKQRRENERTSR